MYRSGSRDYLKRAQVLLYDGNFELLFYAAFELRCGIEARMREYLEVAEDISEKKKQGWRIAELGNDLERAFQVGDKIVQITLEDMASGKQCRIYYTPVTSRLRKQAERLGDYLHALKCLRQPDDPWWKSFKSFLGEICEGLATATTGTLLGPPILRPDGKKMKMHHELEVDPTADPVVRELGRVKGNARMGVRYFDSLPSAELSGDLSAG